MICKLGQPAFRRLKYVLCRIAFENQTLKHPLIGLIQHQNLFAPRRFLRQGHEMAFYPRFGRILCSHLFEHHDVVLAFHGVDYLVVTGWQQNVSNQCRSRQIHIAGVSNSELILLRGGEQAQTQKR